MSQLKEFFEGVKAGQKEFGENILIIINSALLAVVYIIGVGATWLFAKIFWKHFLELNIQKKRKTYWSSLNLSKKRQEEYYRQF